MSLFVDLRHLKSSFNTLSTAVDNMTALEKDKETKRYEERIFETTFRPGVKFSQSQEDVYRESLPSRLRSHLSLPNLDKGYDRAGFQSPRRRDSQAKIVEIEEEKSELTDSPLRHMGDLLAASGRRPPTFDDSGSRHPIDFLEDLSSYFEELRISECKKLPLAVSCLEGVPKLWARCFRGDFHGYEEFERAFREEFWSDERQKAVLYDLKLGKYDADVNAVSMPEYFLRKVASCRHLDPPLSDLEIVYSLAAHFPSPVELEMRLSQRPSVREAYRLLRRREGQGVDFLPNYLFDMCESYQRLKRPDSARKAASSTAPNSSRIPPP